MTCCVVSGCEERNTLYDISIQTSNEDVVVKVCEGHRDMIMEPVQATYSMDGGVNRNPIEKIDDGWYHWDRDFSTCSDKFRTEDEAIEACLYSTEDKTERLRLAMDIGLVSIDIERMILFDPESNCMQYFAYDWESFSDDDKESATSLFDKVLQNERKEKEESS